MASGGIKLAPLLTEIKVDIKNFQSDMDKAKTVGKSAAEEISKELEGVTKTGESLSKVGDYLTLGVTTPILAAGAAVGKFAIDSENSLGMLQGQLGTTSEETERLQEIARRVYENGYGESIDDCIADLSLLRQNVRESKDWTDEMTQSTLEQIKTITTLFDTNADEVTRTAQVMQSSGLTENISESLDLITYGFQNGANYSGEMLDTLREYSPQFVKLGLDGNEAMQYLIQGAENGAFNLDKVGDALKELSIRVVDGSDTTIQGFEAAGLSADEMAQKFAAGGDSAKQAFQETLAGLASIEDPVERNIAGVNLFGTMWEDLGETVILSLADVEGGLEDVEGATERAGERMNESFSTRAISLARQLGDSLLPLGEALLDIGEDALPVVQEGVEAFTEVMEDMDSETAQNIVRLAGLAAATGPVVKVVGGGISTFTRLSSVLGGVSKAMGVFGTTQAAAAAAAGTTTTAVGGAGLTGSMVGLLGTCAPLAAGVAVVGTGIYAMHESAQLAGRSVNEASDDMSLMERALATLNGTEIHTREELEAMGYVYKEFSDELSPEFQEAVEESTQKVQDFNVFLREIGFDDVITQEETDEFTQRVNDTCSEVIATIESRREEAQSGLKELFTADDSVIDESEQRVLEILSRSSDSQISEVQTLQSEIIGIQQTAVDEKRALNEQEIADIEEKNNRIRQIELEAVGGTQEEIEYAKNEFNARIQSMDLESASQLMQEKASIRDEELIQIQASYDTEIDMLKSKIETCNEEDRAALEEQIQNLEQDRDDKIQIQNDLYDEYLKIIEENNPKLLEGINKYTGEILTNQDMTCQKNLDTLRSMYKDLGSITESGCYQMWDSVNQHYSNVAVKVDETTGEIVGVYDSTTNMVAGYCESMGQDAEEMASRQDASFETVVSAAGAYVDYMTGKVVLANGTTIASLDDLKRHTDGTRTGIVNINGTPYRIKVNSSGTISELNRISSTADNATRPRTLIIQVVAENVASAAKTAADAAMRAASQASSRHYNGLDNVPYDGYRAILHKGERVLTAEENRSYSNAPKFDYSKMEQCMRAAVRDMSLVIGNREIGRIIDSRLRERGVL